MTDSRPAFTHAPTKHGLIGPFSGRQLLIAAGAIVVAIVVLVAVTTPLGRTGVNPGPIDTDMNPADGPMADTIRGLTALGRYGQPSEIAEVVAALAGDAGAYVTGASINADGGFTA